MRCPFRCRYHTCYRSLHHKLARCACEKEGNRKKKKWNFDLVRQSYKPWCLIEMQDVVVLLSSFAASQLDKKLLWAFLYFKVCLEKRLLSLVIIILSGSNNSKCVHITFFIWKVEMYVSFFCNWCTEHYNSSNLFLMWTNDLSISVCLSNDKKKNLSVNILRALVYSRHFFFLHLRLFFSFSISDLGCYHANPLLIYANRMFVCLFVCIYFL